MPKRLSEKELYKSKIFTLKQIEVAFDHDKIASFEIVEKKNTALIVPLTSENEVIFIKEYFAAIDQYLIGLPKGRIESGSNELETANKELQEEIGYRAEQLDLLAILTISPGYYTQKTHVYLARGLVVSKLEGDEFEPLEIIKAPLAEFEKFIQSGQLTEARMISALYLTRDFLHNAI